MEGIEDHDGDHGQRTKSLPFNIISSPLFNAFDRMEKVNLNLSEIYWLLDDIVETFDTMTDKDKICRYIWLQRDEFRDTKKLLADAIYLNNSLREYFDP